MEILRNCGTRTAATGRANINMATFLTWLKRGEETRSGIYYELLTAVRDAEAQAVLNGPVCSKCGFDFGESAERYPCPHCGTTARLYSVSMSASVGMRATLKGTHRRPGFAGFVTEFVSRMKRARTSRLLAKEDLRIDRSDPNKTVKTHHVEEFQSDGTWKVEHDHRDEYPAKRRPK